jgi:hypothetical protein
MINHTVYDEKKCALFALGRNAMYAGCQALGLKPGDEVLTPAFDCDGALQPFRVLGLKLVFFKSGPYDFSADVPDIKNKITARTKLLHIVNYFGLPQPWDELLKLRETFNLPILEDNAYSLFSRIGQRCFGTFGDFSIFSLRKTLPLVDGGMLRINNPRLVFRRPLKKARFCYAVEYPDVLRLAVRKMNNNGRCGILKRLSRYISPLTEPPVPLYQQPEEGYPEWPLRDYIDKKFSCDYLRPISGLSRRRLGNFSKGDFGLIAERQRQSYQWLSENLSPISGLKVLWPDLPQGIVPSCLSVLIALKRDVFFAHLKRRYNVMAWPTLSEEVLRQLASFPEVELLGRNLLQIILLPDQVIQPHFPGYLEGLMREIRSLAQKNL